MKYNVAYNNTYRGIRIWSDAADAANNSVHHNLVYRAEATNECAGISVSGPYTHDNTIEHNECHTNDGGIVPSANAHHNTIRYNNCHDNQRGISLNWGANNNTVEHNTSTDNSEGGISLSAPGGGWSAAHHNIVRNNTLDGNGYGITGGHGIGLSTDCHDNLVENNTITNSGDFGINLHQAVDNIIRGNTVNNSGRIGISLWDRCTGNVVEDNDIDGTRIHQGIKVAHWSVTGCDNNIVCDNEVQNATSHGIFVVYATNTTITCNTVHDNGGDGIKIGNDNNLEISDTTTVNWNNIYGNTGFGVNNFHYDGGVPPMLDATCNWWGAHDGPSGEGLGTGDAVSTNVDFDPWIGITDLSGPIDPVQLGNPANISFSFSCNMGTATLDLGDGTQFHYYSNSEIDTIVPHVYSEAGVYTVTLTIENSCGSDYLREFHYVVVYDPSAGFVTGGGWIDSPAGAYIDGETLSGKASFGFVSKYKKGQSEPTGNTEFQFKAGDLNFHSDSYDWLVIAGAKAMYKGTGTINGTGNYGFMLSAIDEKLTPSTNVDLFRIKIWDKNNGDALVYDNNIGEDDDADPVTGIAGGQIVIHKAK